MVWLRRDLWLVFFLFVVVFVSVVSLLFGGKMWLLLEASGVGQGFFTVWMFLVVLVLLGCLGFVVWFVRSQSSVVVPVVPDKKEVVSVKLARDEGRRLTVLSDLVDEKKASEDVWKAEKERQRLEREREKEKVESVVGDGNTYYDNGYYDVNGVFHLYEENSGGM